MDSNQGYNPYKWVICPLTRVINLHITSYLPYPEPPSTIHCSYGYDRKTPSKGEVPPFDPDLGDKGLLANSFLVRDGQLIHDISCVWCDGFPVYILYTYLVGGFNPLEKY